MNKILLFLLITVFALASCEKSEVAFVSKAPSASNTTGTAKGSTLTAKATDNGAVAAKGGPGGGSGGGGNNPPISNLDIYIKQLIGSWLTVVGIPGTTGTIFMTATYKADNTFTMVAVNNVTGGRTSFSGTWQFTIPANIPINESGLLVMNSGGKTLLSGFLLFVHPGVTIYTTPVNNLPAFLQGAQYAFQKT